MGEAAGKELPGSMTSAAIMFFGLWLFVALLAGLVTTFVDGWDAVSHSPSAETLFFLLFFSVEGLGLLFSILLVWVGWSQGIPHLSGAGVLFALRYVFFMLTVVLGAVPAFYYFELLPIFPPVIFFFGVLLSPLTWFTTGGILAFAPAFTYVFPLTFLLVGLNRLKERAKWSASLLDNAIFCAFLSFFLGPLMFGLALILFGWALRRSRPGAASHQ